MELRHSRERQADLPVPSSGLPSSFHTDELAQVLPLDFLTTYSKTFQIKCLG